jgi:hypothetical protein
MLLLKAVFAAMITVSFLGARRQAGKTQQAKHRQRHQERGSGFSHDRSPIDSIQLLANGRNAGRILSIEMPGMSTALKQASSIVITI